MEPSREGASAVDVVARGFFVAPTPLSGDALGPDAVDATVLQGMRASTADGSGGGTFTGVCASKRFCAMHKRAMLRSRIQVRRRGWSSPRGVGYALRRALGRRSDRLGGDSARVFGSASAWHSRETGIGFAAGMNMKRLTEMVMGALEAARWPAGACAARDLAAAAARDGMDRVFPPTSAENVNVRAMLAVGLQG